MQVSRKTQWWLIVGGYAAISLYAAYLLYVRHRNMPHDPTIASSGMYAILLYFVPTIFLLRLIAADLQVFGLYSYVLMLVSITAPMALVVIILNSAVNGHMMEDAAEWRIFGSPVVLILMGVSRWMAATKRAKKWINYALLAEGATLLIAVATIILASAGIDIHFTN